MHAVYKANRPKGERKLREASKQQESTKYHKRNTSRNHPLSRTQKIDRVRAYSKGPYIPE